MLTFTLGISCLTTSNLPWFVDLTFQVPMQYCSLQHQTFLLSPVTSTTGYCFCFGSIPSFFLELFLHWSPVAYWVPTDLGSSSFGILSFCLFILYIYLHIQPSKIANNRKKNQPTIIPNQRSQINIALNYFSTVLAYYFHVSWNTETCTNTAYGLSVLILLSVLFIWYCLSVPALYLFLLR